MRRRNANNRVVPPALEDLTLPDRHPNSVFDSGSREEGNNILNLGGERQLNNWLMEPPNIDFQNPSLLFGSLLDDYPVGSGESHTARRPNPLREFRTRREYHLSYSY